MLLIILPTDDAEPNSSRGRAQKIEESILYTTSTGMLPFPHIRDNTTYGLSIYHAIQHAASPRVLAEELEKRPSS